MKKIFTFTVLSVFMVIVAFGVETNVTPGVLNALNDAVLAADSGDVLILEADGITKEMLQAHLGMVYLHRYYTAELEWLDEIINHMNEK